MPTYTDRLDAQIRAKGTPTLVGLDPRWDMLPTTITSRAASRSGTIHERTANAFEVFCCELVDVVAPLVAAVKPQVAFFEQLGPPGMAALKTVMRHARRNGLIVIADAKRGDIGSTAVAYANAWLAGEDEDAAPWPSDALTVNPYLGGDSLQPLIDVAADRNAGLYVLVRTSNPGAAELQDLRAEGRTVYEHVAATVQSASDALRGGSRYGCVGAVLGATWPRQITELRKAMPSVPLLIPGYGTQGGSSSDTAAAFDSDGLGAVVNSSRGINFAYNRKPYKEQFGTDLWQDAVAAATRDMIADLAEHTPASALQSSND